MRSKRPVHRPLEGADRQVMVAVAEDLLARQVQIGGESSPARSITHKRVCSAPRRSSASYVDHLKGGAGVVKAGDAVGNGAADRPA